VVQNHSDVEEIALRLARCFDDPFSVGSCIVHGSASIGMALYPADATTGDDLLKTADSAMYVAKNMKKSSETAASGQLDRELTTEGHR
jgi:GGDEF domain-containing protein